MSRRRVGRRNKVSVDSRYGDMMVSNFILRMMRNGKKSTSATILYSALDQASSESSEKPLTLFNQAINNVKPLVEVKSRRVGGSTYQVPVEVNARRQEALAMRWIILAARQKKGKSMSTHLKNEFLDACRNTGTAIKRKEDMYRMAESNKAFSHYRW